MQWPFLVVPWFIVGLDLQQFALLCRGIQQSIAVQQHTLSFLSP